MSVTATQMALAAVALWLFVIPIASLAAGELWWGDANRWRRLTATMLWPLALGVLWAAIAIYFPLSWLRAGILRAGRPLHRRGWLPRWLVTVLNWLIRRLPE